MPQRSLCRRRSGIQLVELRQLSCHPVTDPFVGLQAEVVVTIHQEPSDLSGVDLRFDFLGQSEQLVDGVIAELADEVTASSPSKANTLLECGLCIESLFDRLNGISTERVVPIDVEFSDCPLNRSSPEETPMRLASALS